MQTQTTTTDAPRFSFPTHEYEKITKDVLINIAHSRGVTSSRSAARSMPKADLITALRAWDAEHARVEPEPEPTPVAPEPVTVAPAAYVTPAMVFEGALHAPKPRRVLTGAQRAAKRKRNKRKHKAEIRRRDYH